MHNSQICDHCREKEEQLDIFQKGREGDQEKLHKQANWNNYFE